VRHLLDGYGVTARYDLIRKKLVIHGSLWSSTPDNADNVAMTHIVSLACLNGLPRGDIEAYVAAVAEANPINPVADWILSLSWDGTDRLPAFYNTLVIGDSYPWELKALLMRKWGLSAVAAVLMPKGFRCRGVLTLQGPQSLGKTSWVSSLVPDAALRDAVVKVDHHLDANNKDSILGACCHWLVEIGELESSMKKEVARLKGVLTRDSDKVRKPYARAESEMPRRTVFVATVNEANFLVDDTGNSRWWVIPVVAVDYQHGIDMQQLFAELAVDFEAGEQWWLTAEEEALLDEHNRPHRAISVIEDQLLEVIDLHRERSERLVPLTPREVLELIGVEKPTNAQCKECAGILRTYLGNSKRINGRDKWRVPFALDARGNPKIGPDEYYQEAGEDDD
jgi:putative DNA primase/helicase